MLLPVPSVPHFEWSNRLRWALGRIHQMPAGTRWLPASALRYPFRAIARLSPSRQFCKLPPPSHDSGQICRLQRPHPFSKSHFVQACSSQRQHASHGSPAKLGPRGRRFAGVTPREVTPGQLAGARSMVRTAVTARREARSPPGPVP